MNSESWLATYTRVVLLHQYAAPEKQGPDYCCSMTHMGSQAGPEAPVMSTIAYHQLLYSGLAFTRC